MDIPSLLLSALLFLLFVPGVLVRLPPGGSHKVVLATHTILFALVLHFVMSYYWRHIRRVEMFGNYGSASQSCPNGYMVGINQGGKPDCVPIGHTTYPATAK